VDKIRVVVDRALAMASALAVDVEAPKSALPV
jgi:hypothetical protein